MKPMEQISLNLLQNSLKVKKEVYKVKSIIRHQQRGQGYQHLVKWKDYLITDVTWENKLAFSDDGDMLSNYKDQHQL